MPTFFGPTGPTGPTIPFVGPTGPSGVSPSFPAPTGNTGPTGQTANGPTGVTGPSGTIGPTGVSGSYWFDFIPSPGALQVIAATGGGSTGISTLVPPQEYQLLNDNRVVLYNCLFHTATPPSNSAVLTITTGHINRGPHDVPCNIGFISQLTSNTTQDITGIIHSGSNIVSLYVTRNSDGTLQPLDTSFLNPPLAPLTITMVTQYLT